MSRYTGKRGIDAKQLCIAVVITLILFAIISVKATADFCDLPVSDQVRDMLLVPLE